MSNKYYIADEDGIEFRIFNTKESADHFLELRPECTLSRSSEEKPLTYPELLAKHGKAPF